MTDPAPNPLSVAHHTLDDTRRAKLLAALAEGGSRRQACRAAGVGKTQFYELLKRDEEFAEAVAEAEEESTDEIENALWEAASSGNIAAMVFYLTNRRPDKWQDRRQPQAVIQQNLAPDHQQLLKDAYQQLTDEARRAIEDATRRQLAAEYPSAVRVACEQGHMVARAALTHDRPGNRQPDRAAGA